MAAKPRLTRHKNRSLRLPNGAPPQAAHRAPPPADALRPTFSLTPQGQKEIRAGKIEGPIGSDSRVVGPNPFGGSTRLF